jgi:hypothetical protein
VVTATSTHLCQTKYVWNVGVRREGRGSLHANDVLHATTNPETQTPVTHMNTIPFA